MRRTVCVVAMLLAAVAVCGCDRDKEYRMDDLVRLLLPRDRPAVLQDAVTSDDADARRKAVYQMRKWKDPSDELIELVGLTLLGDSDRMVRAQAAETLGAWAEPSSVEHLAKALRNDEDPFVRADCADALGQISGQPSVEALLDRLRFDPEADVRIACARSLKLHRDLAAAEGLLYGLVDPRLAVRDAAEESLRYMTGQDLGFEPDPWRTFLAETGEPLADYGHPPKRTARSDQRVDVDAGKKAKLKEIISDLFPLERKKGQFD
ncbi:MAG: HEAT repeat domain-containing protein [Planctomycetes bacterium]|nr:HEAT repeat domain-containing protein [Planctomycetota bacterium]